MPYIKPTYRKILNPLIDDVSYIGTADLATKEGVYNELHELLEGIPDSKRDSFLNYMFTFILLKHKSLISNDFIRHVIKNEFLIDPTYDKLERCVGLLNCMINEFLRRKWNITIPHNYIFLKHQLDFVNNAYVGCYEQEKMEQNGDI